jgi:hypothetical protein
LASREIKLPERDMLYNEKGRGDIERGERGEREGEISWSEEFIISS